MKRVILIFSLLLCTLASAQDYSALDSLMTQFFAAMEYEDADSRNSEADFLIGTCRDSLTRQHVAESIFDHYRESRVMGEESVAIHVYDAWFASGKVKFHNEIDSSDAELFVNFNRASQLGMQAPAVRLRRPCGGRLTIPERGRTAVLFFFDTSCAKCRLEAALLPQVMKEVDFDIVFYAVYCGSDRKAWREFRKAFDLGNPRIKLVHLWDPEMDSDYQLSYGVYGTPRVFMTDPDGTIIGRRLEVESLMQLIPVAGAIQATWEKYR